MRKLIILIALAIGGWQWFSQSQFASNAVARLNNASPTAEAPAQFPPRGIEPASASNFRCDGRIHCSQMTSCAEATYFLRNCPGTKMDGNNDGVPCEQQRCGR